MDTLGGGADARVVAESGVRSSCLLRRAPRCQESRLPPDSNLNPTQPPFPTTSLLECRGQGMVFSAVGTVIKISIKGNALLKNDSVSAVNKLQG